MAEFENSEEFRQLQQAIAALDVQRVTLGDAVVDAALSPMRQQLEELKQAQGDTPLVYGDERKQVTVMFADFSGLTSLSEKLDLDQGERLE